METDIRGAIEMGMQAYLVLTGSTTREMLQSYPFTPTQVFDSIADLVTLEADDPAPRRPRARKKAVEMPAAA